MSAAPRSDAAAAAPAPGGKKPPCHHILRPGHHKLYLAAASLVAVCVWLIVWLVVFGKVLPDDIVGFAAVVFQVTVKSGVFALLFARYVAGAGAVVAPAAPEGKVGTAPGLRAWAHEAFELDAASARAGRRRRGAARPADPDAARLFASLGVAGRAAGVRLRAGSEGMRVVAGTENSRARALHGRESVLRLE